jgi:hypothetical protein
VCEISQSSPLLVAHRTALNTGHKNSLLCGFPLFGNLANWSISPDFGVPVSVREENEDMYAWTVDDEIDRGATQAIDQAEMIPEVAGSAAQRPQAQQDRPARLRTARSHTRQLRSKRSKSASERSTLILPPKSGEHR